MNMGRYFGFIFVFAYLVASTLAQDDSSNSSVVISCPTGPDISSYDFNLHLISFLCYEAFWDWVILATAFAIGNYESSMCKLIVGLWCLARYKNDNLNTADHNENPNDHSENQNLEFFGGNTLLSSDAQIIGIIILEIGICFHSVIIGMALSVSTGSNFISLWVALVFHQARIAELNYPENSIKPWLMSCAYGLTTPIGIAMGLGVHESYNPASQTALIVQRTLNSLLAEFYIFCFG
ncbi:ZIP zinc/iron transport family [Gigaspora margarita]|uniref:ZIP zinc/iron transport family n=1 Tax=Gigaspora margarita TaxID=4874 RepID=A0A8H4AVL9_GIGMA|nr:ZIP zinc/iron transport family [Gigaspora margarita]